MSTAWQRSLGRVGGWDAGESGYYAAPRAERVCGPLAGRVGGRTSKFHELYLGALQGTQKAVFLLVFV